MFDDKPMSRVQVAAVAITVLLTGLDGYDVLSVTFAAPAISQSWGIGKASLGVVLSSGLAGMALGSFFLAPFADVVGRRALVLVSLALMAVGMLLSAYASSVGALVAFRIITGLGIGATVPIATALSSEFSNVRRRPMAAAAMAVGYPVGGLIGGAGAGALLQLYDWPAIFLTGFVAGLILLPLSVVLLPEPPSFLIARRRPDSLARINALMRRCGHPELDALPAIAPARHTGYAAIFARADLAVTLRLTAINALFVVAVYFVLSWLPQMVADAGFPPATASKVAGLANLVGVAGGLALGWLAPRFGLRRLTAAVMTGLGIAMVIFGFAPPSLPMLMAAAALCGFFLFGGMSGLYATLARGFGTAARASGSGFVVGIGRVASAICPIFAGWLFANGMDRAEVSCVFGAFALCASALLIFAGRIAPSGEATVI